MKKIHCAHTVTRMLAAGHALGAVDQPISDLILCCGSSSGPGAPLTYFTDGGSEGSEILAKRYILGLWKTLGIFLVSKKTQGFFWVLYFSSAQINNNVSAIYCWCGIFLGIKHEPLLERFKYILDVLSSQVKQKSTLLLFVFDPRRDQIKSEWFYPFLPTLT